MRVSEISGKAKKDIPELSPEDYKKWTEGQNSKLLSLWDHCE